MHRLNRGWLLGAWFVVGCVEQQEPRPAATFELSGVSTPIIAGTPQSLTVTVRDASGAIATGYRGTAAFQSNDPAGVVPAPYAFKAADAGQHTFPGLVVLKTAGARTISAADTAQPSLRGSLVATVQAAEPSELRLSGLDPQLVAGQSATTTTALFDPFGNPATGYRGTVRFTSTDSRATLPAEYRFTESDAGAHTFTAGVLLRTMGVQTVTVTGEATLALKHAAQTVAVVSQAAPTGSQTVTVLPAAASTIVLSGLSASVPAATASSVTLTVRDPFGNTATGYRGTVHFTCTDPASTLPADHAFTAADAGVANFPASIILRTAATQVITVTDVATSSISGSASVIVNPAAATSIVLSAAPSVTAGAPTSMTVTAFDSSGNVATSYRGTVAFTSGDSQATVPPPYTFAAGDAGIHTFSSGFVLRTAGAQTVTATDLANLISSAHVTVIAAPATRLSVSGFPATTAGVQGSFTVRALDAFGNVDTSYAGTVRFSSTDPQATLPPDSTLASGTSTLTATLRTAGTQSITATDAARSTITGAQTGISVGPAGAVRLAVGGFPGSITAGTAAAVQVTAFDAFGNTATGYTGAVHVTSTDPQAVLPADSVLSQGTRSFTVTLRSGGTQSIAAADTVNAGISGSQTGIAVSAAPASVLALHGFPDAVTAGVVGTVSVFARDAFGNLDTGFGGLVHLSSTDAKATLPADAPLTAGAGSFQVTLATAGTQAISAASGRISGSQSGILVSAAGAARLDVTGIPDPVVAGVPSDFTVTAHDGFGNVAVGYLGTVHFSSTDALATLPPDTTFTARDRGQRPFPGGVTFRTAGTQAVIATDTGSPSFPQIDMAASVLQYHRSRTRDGLFVDAAFTRAAAGTVLLDTAFNAPVTGQMYAQPLYVAQPGGTDLVISATNRNEVTAFAARTGAIVWRRTAADIQNPVPRTSMPCGNIDPVGIIGTPIVDAASRTVFFDAMTTPDGGTTKKHLIYGLSIDDGSLRPAWPIDVGATASFNGTTFNAPDQNQRGALSLVGGVLYVPYGGHFGDCGNYHGWLVGVPILNPSPSAVMAWATAAGGGAIWAPNGTSSDGASIFAATGNTFGVTTWGGGESVLRFSQGPAFSGLDTDRFTAFDWQVLDQFDVDMGSSGPLLVDLPGNQLAVQMGKNGKVYLLDRNNLGGVSNGLFSQKVSSGLIMNGPAAVHDAAGTTVSLSMRFGFTMGCAGDRNLAALRVYPGSPPAFGLAWCGTVPGDGPSPIVTTTDGSSNAIVWVVGTQGDNRLHGYDADTGAVLYAGGGPADQMGVVQHFNTPLVARGWLYVGGDGKVYGFHPR